MAKLTAPLFSVTASGSLGKQINYRTTARGAVAAAPPRIKPPPSEIQYERRDNYLANCYNWHEHSQEWRAQWAVDARPLGLTGFNLYMRTSMLNDYK